MNRKIRVTNLTPTARDRDVAILFASDGEVRSAEIVADAASGLGGTAVAVVEMSSRQQGEAAIAALNGRTYCGLNLRVCWEEPRPPDEADPTPARAEAAGPAEQKAMIGKFPLSNFGLLGGGLRRFADRDGNVPENGVGFGSMNYPPTWAPDREEWDAFVAEAVEATDDAEATQRTWPTGE